MNLFNGRIELLTVKSNVQSNTNNPQVAIGRWHCNCSDNCNNCFQKENHTKIEKQVQNLNKMSTFKIYIRE